MANRCTHGGWLGRGLEAGRGEGVWTETGRGWVPEEILAVWLWSAYMEAGRARVFGRKLAEGEGGDAGHGVHVWRL